VSLFKRRFADLIERQLRVFVEDHAGLLGDVRAAERHYERAPRDEAEERYGDYLDLVETATETLADLRDHFAATLPEGDDEEYEAAFNRAVRKRWPLFGLEIENR
jgi:hypothetical protein